MFQPNFKNIVNSDHISAWKSQGLSDENIKRPATSASNLASWLDYIGVRTKVKFDGQCLKQDQVTFTYKKIVNMYIVYEAIWRLRQDDDFT